MLPCRNLTNSKHSYYSSVAVFCCDKHCDQKHFRKASLVLAYGSGLPCGRKGRPASKKTADGIFHPYKRNRERGNRKWSKTITHRSPAPVTLPPESSLSYRFCNLHKQQLRQGTECSVNEPVGKHVLFRSLQCTGEGRGVNQEALF